MLPYLYFISCFQNDEIIVDVTSGHQPEQEGTEVEIEREPSGQGVSSSIRFIGEDPRDWSGYAIAGGGDSDGDGLTDILIGSYGSDEGGDHAGKTHLFFSSSLPTSGDVFLADADHHFIGMEDYDHSGMSVQSKCDLDGDEVDDIIIGAPYNKKTFVVFASSLSAKEHHLGDADHILLGENAGDYVGWSIDCGDVDGDDAPDLLIGADGSDYGGYSAGLTYLLLNSTLGEDQTLNMELADYKFIGESIGDNSGQSVNGAGDIDGDGLMDILIGADGNDQNGEQAGKAYVFLAGDLGSHQGGRDIVVDDAEFGLVGEGSYEEAGSALSTAGDVDGDGYDDILVGAPSPESFSPQIGKAYLVFADSLGSYSDLADADVKFTGERDNAGISLASLGDIDGDGKSDILVGAPALYSYTNGGDAFILLSTEISEGGHFSLIDSPYFFGGETPMDRAGRSLANAGDVDGDGEIDILIGAPENDIGGAGAGATYLITGMQ
jgi:hypothetical protein